MAQVSNSVLKQKIKSIEKTRSEAQIYDRHLSGLRKTDSTGPRIAPNLYHSHVEIQQSISQSTRASHGMPQAEHM